MRVKTKRALREKLRDYPSEVVFDRTENTPGPQRYRGDDLPEDGTKFSVCGPDPYTNRKWYATVERTDKGIKVT